MMRLFSIIIFLCFTWTTIIQALPYHEITKTQEGISIGLSAAMVMGDGVLGKVAGLGDMAFSDKETKRRWIEEKTAFIATEQLYLSVGKTFVTRSVMPPGIWTST